MADITDIKYGVLGIGCHTLNISINRQYRIFPKWPLYFGHEKIKRKTLRRMLGK